MQKKISIYVLYLLIGVFLWGGCLGREDDTAAQVVGLKCRGLVDPIGIDEPIFSWQIVSEEHGFIQSAWEIEIASSLKALETGDCIWSSGRVESATIYSSHYFRVGKEFQILVACAYLGC